MKWVAPGALRYLATWVVAWAIAWAILVPVYKSQPKPVTNEEIKAMLLETQRNQLQLAAMVLYSEDRIKETIEQSRPRPLLPEVR